MTEYEDQQQALADAMARMRQDTIDIGNKMMNRQPQQQQQAQQPTNGGYRRTNTSDIYETPVLNTNAYDNPAPSQPFQNEHANIEVRADGTMVNNDSMEVRGNNLPNGQVGQNVLATARSKAGMPRNASNVSPNDLVVIDGVEMEVQQAMNLGILSQANGRPTEVNEQQLEAQQAQQAQHQADQQAQVQQVQARRSYLDQTAEDVIGMMAAHLGSREQAEGVIKSAMASFSKPGEQGNPNERAIKRVVQEIGASPEVAGKILDAVLNPVWENGMAELAERTGRDIRDLQSEIESKPALQSRVMQTFFNGNESEVEQLANHNWSHHGEYQDDSDGSDGDGDN